MKGLLIDVGLLPNCILVVGRKMVVGETNLVDCTDVFTKHRERFRILGGARVGAPLQLSCDSAKSEGGEARPLAVFLQD
jgi:hypothetical protein